MPRSATVLLATVLLAPAAAAADWSDLLRNGLDDWVVLGDGIWRLRSDGVLTAYRAPDKKLFAGRESVTAAEYKLWDVRQSWLYTRREFEEFDLRLEYWVRSPGNSGISIRDPSQAAWGIADPPDFRRTPSKLGYEIQINSEWADKWGTGSIYGLARAKEGLQRVGEWNGLNIESCKEAIRVYVNGVLAAEHPGDPKRPTKGPIGLQLHDQHSVVMFRNIWILER